MKNPNYPEWLQNEDIPNISISQHNLAWTRWSELFLLKKALAGGPCLVRYTYDCAKIDDQDRLFKLINEVGFKLVVKTFSTKGERKLDHIEELYYFVSNDGDMQLQKYNDGIDFIINCSDENKVARLVEILKKETQTVNRTKYVHVVVSTEDGPDLREAGSAHTPLVRDNYEKAVVDDFDFVVNQMNSKSPCGRLVIMNGAPGTGKTYLVRGLIDTVENAMFILVPPTMLVELAGPGLIQIILSARGNKEEESPGPIVLICEDADDLLVPRMGDNLPQISSLLNFGDGILGNLLDIRVIATTNAKKIEIDKALLRPGRLCRHIDVAPLGEAVAANVYKRLSGKEAKFSQGTTLAEIYQKANVEDKNGVAHQNFDDAVVGFKK